MVLLLSHLGKFSWLEDVLQGYPTSCDHTVCICQMLSSPAKDGPRAFAACFTAAHTSLSKKSLQSSGRLDNSQKFVLQRNNLLANEDCKIGKKAIVAAAVALRFSIGVVHSLALHWVLL